MPHFSPRLTHLTPTGANPGALGAAIYTPANLPDAPALVVALHGSSQSAEEYNRGTGWSTLAEQLGIVLLFPEQTSLNNATRGFNWFERRDNERGLGEPMSISELIEQVVQLHSIDRTRIFITGMSAGGAMTSVMLAAYPEVFAGGAIIAGLPFDRAANLWEAVLLMNGYSTARFALNRSDRSIDPSENLKLPSVSVWHGRYDSVVDVSNAALIVQQWAKLHHVNPTATRAVLVDGHIRNVWCAAMGREVIEEFIIEGMGHGAPVDGSDLHTTGSSERYMLDVGISSTRRISEFWSLSRIN
jgi:poly(hydroxyalkanoate) depolymerase family esterase